MIALVFVLMVGIGLRSDRSPDSANPAIQSARNAAAAPADDSGVGYMWWTDQPNTSIFVISPAQQSSPVSKEQASAWASRGELAQVLPGTKAWRSTGKHPWATSFVEVAEGPFAGFRGWIPMEAWQGSRPPGSD